jgi:hypothetical protein
VLATLDATETDSQSPSESQAASQQASGASSRVNSAANTASQHRRGTKPAHSSASSRRSSSRQDEDGDDDAMMAEDPLSMSRRGTPNGTCDLHFSRSPPRLLFRRPCWYIRRRSLLFNVVDFGTPLISFQLFCRWSVGQTRDHLPAFFQVLARVQARLPVARGGSVRLPVDRPYPRLVHRPYPRLVHRRTAAGQRTRETQSSQPHLPKSRRCCLRFHFLRRC